MTDIKILDNEQPQEEVTLDQEQLDNLKDSLYMVLQKGYTTNNFVRLIVVAESLIDTVQEMILSMQLPPVVLQLLHIEKGEDDPELGIQKLITQSDVELNYLSERYKSHPVLQKLKEEGAPIMLSLADLKMLFMLEMWDKTRNTSKIYVPGT